MEVLELDGKTYVKASSIARDLGYTSDYVGQLCRGGKVDAQLVGRSWYVSDESIRSHKDSRYRSTKAKSKKNLAEQKREVIESASSEKDANKVPLSVSAHNFYNKVKPLDAQYVEDDTDLIPTLTEKKSGSSVDIAVQHADAKSVFIGKQAQSYSMEAGERPKIRFKGKLPVNSTDDTAEPESPLEEKAEAEEVKVSEEVVSEKEAILEDKIDIELDVEDKDDIKEKKVPLRRNGVISMRKITNVDEKSEEELVISKTYIRSSKPRRSIFTHISISILLAVILTVGLFVVEQTVIISTSDNIDITKYGINTQSVIELIYR